MASNDNLKVTGVMNALANGLGTGKFGVSVNDSIRSISSRAAASTYFFPVLVSNTIDPNAAHTIIDNLEFAYGDFVKACFYMQPAMKVDARHGDTLNLEDYLKKFHQNIGIKSSNELFLSVKLNENAEYIMFPNGILNEAFSSPIREKETDDSVNITDIDNRPFIDPDKDREKFVTLQSYNLKDLEKRNAIAATPISVKVTFIFASEPVEENIVVGVKATTHPTTSEDLVSQISNTIKNNGIIHNLVRYTSGEINSIKDIFIDTKAMKTGVQGKTIASKWFSTIAHRNRLNKITMGLLAKKPYLPNVSIIITTDDVAEIQRRTGIDLLKDARSAAKFISDNLLLSLVVYDPALEMVNVLFDGYSEYTAAPLKSLKRDNEKSAENAAAILRAISGRM